MQTELDSSQVLMYSNLVILGTFSVNIRSLHLSLLISTNAIFRHMYLSSYDYKVRNDKTHHWNCESFALYFVVVAFDVNSSKSYRLLKWSKQVALCAVQGLLHHLFNCACSTSGLHYLRDNLFFCWQQIQPQLVSVSVVLFHPDESNFPADNILVS